jgi:hypothetical protein
MKNISPDDINTVAVYEDLYAYISGCRIISTHSHHFSDGQYLDANLEQY